MISLEQFTKKRAFRTAMFVLVLAAGAFMRLYALGQVPRGINSDEAMSAYQAYTLLTSGIDLNGYHNPVYFVAWGGGMNALEIYLMIPFIRLLGLTELAIRLPQAILGVISLPVFFLLLRRLFDETTAWIGFFLLAISPWHIMLSRWALESNLAPAFLLFGLYFLSVALDRRPAFLLLSGAFFGLSLYSYAITWMVVPLMLALLMAYALFTRTFQLSLYSIAAVVALFLLALPLLLFVAVNQGWLPEIRNAVFSVPLMPQWRSNVLTTQGLVSLQSFYRLFDLLVTQSDGYLYNSFPQFGLYYLFSLPLALYGAVCSLKSVFSALRRRSFSAEALIHIQLLAGLLVCLLIDTVNVNRSNFIYLPVIALCAYGVRQLLLLPRKAVFQTVVAAYAVSFLAFAGFYFGDGRKELADHYRPGTREAIAYANELTDDTVICRVENGYIKVLYNLAYPVEEYRDTVVYKDPPYPNPASFGKFVFEDPGETETDGTVYIAQDEEAQAFLDAGFTVDTFNRMIVAIRPESGGGN